MTRMAGRAGGRAGRGASRWATPGTRRAARRGPALFLAWGAIGGRSAELSDALGGEALCCFPPGTRRPPALARYALSFGWTAGRLLRTRPSAVVVTNPPVFPGLLAVAYGRLFGAPVVLDDHPGAFGAMGYTIGRWMAPFHRWLVPHARLCLVTADEWAAEVEAWGGRALVLHESPADWEPAPPAPLHDPPTILFVSTFAPDEPVVEVLDAARRCPELRLLVTGDLRRRPPADVPPNACLIGFLGPDEYRRQVLEADVVLSLTTEPTSAMRAAFEATWAEKPLVVPDWPLSRRLFPQAIAVGNTPDEIAAGLREAVARHDELLGSARAARRQALARWEAQLDDLREAVASGGVQ